jgi:DNA-binding LacI/PurR family transcriptional regulator
MNSAQLNLYERLRQRLRDGRLKPGDRMPSEREMAEEMNVGRTALRPVLDALEADGFLVRRPQAGTFLAAIPPPSAQGATIALIAAFDAAAHGLHMTDPGWLHRVAASFEKVAALANASLVILDQSPFEGDPCSVKTLALQAADAGANAAVLIHPAGTKSVIAHAMSMLHDRNVHPVIVSARTYSGLASQVYFDSAWGSYLATRHLTEHGHKRIGYAAATAGHEWVHERLAGYREALEAAEIEPREAWTHLAGDGERMPSREDGASALEHWLSMPKEERPTAVVAGNDTIALGLIAEARKRGLRVPEDLSVVGFDNDPIAMVTRLTTIDRPTEALGEAVAQVTLERLAAGSAPATVVHRLRPVLVERDTVAKPQS